MDSNEQTELTGKTDRLIDGEQMTASGRGGGVKGWSKKVKGLMDVDNSVVTSGGGKGNKETKW